MEKKYPTIPPYLIVKDALSFFEFTKNAFNVQEVKRLMRDDKILIQGEIMINDSLIMFADATQDFSVQMAGLFIIAENADATYQKALDSGAHI